MKRMTSFLLKMVILIIIIIFNTLSIDFAMNFEFIVQITVKFDYLLLLFELGVILFP